MSLAKKLKQLRVAKKQSLQEVADAIGSSKAHIWDLESGKAKNPTLELLKKLAKYFKISVSNLVGEEEGKENEEFNVMFRGYKELTKRDRGAIKTLIEAFQKPDTNDNPNEN